jgi:DNA-binding transcriptional LysR family regulator
MEHRELTERNVEFVIVRKSSPIVDERLHFEFLFNDYYVVAADVKNPWARRRRIALGELVNESWVLPPLESVPGSVIAKAFPGTGLAYPRGTVFTGAEVRLSLVTTGRFLTIVPASALRFPTRRPEIKILPVALPEPNVPTGIVTLKNRALGPVARLFIEHAREVAKQLAK